MPVGSFVPTWENFPFGYVSEKVVTWVLNASHERQSWQQGRWAIFYSFDKWGKGQIYLVCKVALLLLEKDLLYNLLLNDKGRGAMVEGKFLPFHFVRMKLEFILARGRIALLKIYHQLDISLYCQKRGLSKCKTVMYMISILYRKK